MSIQQPNNSLLVPRHHQHNHHQNQKCSTGKINSKFQRSARQPQTNLPILQTPFINHISPAAEVYDYNGDDVARSEKLDVNESELDPLNLSLDLDLLSENDSDVDANDDAFVDTDVENLSNFKTRLETPGLRQSSSANRDHLHVDKELHVETSNHRNQHNPHQRKLTQQNVPFLIPNYSQKQKHPNLSSSNLAFSLSEKPQPLDCNNVSRGDVNGQGNPDLDTSVRSTGGWSTKSMPVEFQTSSGPGKSGCGMAHGSSATAAEISKSRYALQNKKLVEELEHRT